MSCALRFLARILVLVLLPSIAVSQTLVLDLGIVDGTETVRPGTYQLRIDNRILRFAYKVSAIVRNVPILPFENDLSVQVAITRNAQDCSTIQKAVERLLIAYASTSEAAVKTAVDAALTVNQSTPGCVEAKRALALIIEASQIRMPNVYTLRTGQELVVTVERAEAGQPPAQWTRTFTTGPRGQWRTTYGFAVAFTSMSAGSSLFAKKRSFYLETAGTTSTIHERKDRSGADLVPAVLFHFMPTEAESQRFVAGPNAGISFDGTNPSVMGGYGWTYEQNVNLSFGLTARREPVLLPKYKIGSVVAAGVDDGQLTEMKLRIRPYVVLTLRLSTSPFSSGGNAQEEKDGE